MNRSIVVLMSLAIGVASATAAPKPTPLGNAANAVERAQQPPSGDAEIRAVAGPSEIVIRTTNRLAGAIDSLTWNGREFIDSHDHGRQLQSASSFDCGVQTSFSAERYNPTEAGSRSDGAGPTSTSRLIALQAHVNTLKTTTQMAYWLAPGEKTPLWKRPAFNASRRSNHRLTKRVQIGVEDLPHAIQYDVTFHVPADERRHTMGQFEAVTGYMPAAFSTFLKLNVATGELLPLTDGPGEQAMPVVLSTPNGLHAMGVISPDQPSPGYDHAGYGRFRFARQKVVKWNCVFRVRNDDDEPEASIPRGDYRFRCFIAVGTREDVRATLMKLHDDFAR